MPELPEVETVKNILASQLIEHVVTDVVIIRPEIIAHPSAEELKNRLSGTRFLRLSRRGKFIIMEMADESELIIHLRMTGQLIVTDENHPFDKHTHVVFKLNNKKELRFIDQRRFGRIWLKTSYEEDDFTGISKLGLEPFDKDFDARYLQKKLGLRQATIKQGLLMQEVIAGIGNIYSDEILFLCGIHPQRKMCTLEEFEWIMLADAIPYVLKLGIEDNKMTAEEYLAGEGKKYSDKAKFKVYGHEGKPCLKCGTSLVRIVIGGRSSCFCSNCQK